MRLDGISTPICTPFLLNGEFSPVQLRANIEKWNKTGVSGYVATGSSGEVVLLTREETLQVWEVVREAAAPGKLLIAGTGAESVEETIELTRLAAERGCDAALVRTPHYFKAQMNRPETQLTYFRMVADAASVPILLYNVPQMTGLDLPVEVVIQLARHPNILGIKESLGNVEKVARMVDGTPEEFQVLVGSAATLYPSLAIGAVGGILGLANAAPCASLGIYEAWKARDHEAARERHRVVARAAVATAKFGIPGFKHAMDLNGYYGGPCRLPLLPLRPTEKEEVEEAFREVRA